MKKMPQWLKKAVFYEIYPQSFCDTNGDGIGDIEGIIEKLDYIRSLGCNALWINPWYDSPFKDAGYDVRDFKKIAPRYGTNEDARHLFEEAHRKGIHVLLEYWWPILHQRSTPGSGDPMGSEKCIHRPVHLDGFLL